MARVTASRACSRCFGDATGKERRSPMTVVRRSRRAVFSWVMRHLTKLWMGQGLSHLGVASAAPNVPPPMMMKSNGRTSPPRAAADIRPGIRIGAEQRLVKSVADVSPEDVAGEVGWSSGRADVHDFFSFSNLKVGVRFPTLCVEAASETTLVIYPYAPFDRSMDIFIRVSFLRKVAAFILTFFGLNSKNAKRENLATRSFRVAFRRDWHQLNYRAWRKSGGEFESINSCLEDAEQIEMIQPRSIVLRTDSCRRAILGTFRRQSSFRSASGNMANTDLWSEFLRRFAPRIRFYLRKTLWRQNGTALQPHWINEENDLFQNTILRLLDRDCAILKRFIAAREEEFIAYLAVIAESVVRDSLRRRMAHKRPNECRRNRSEDLDFAVSENSKGARPEEPVAERRLLAKEVWSISLRTIKNLSGSLYVRDRRIFELYFSQGLSVHSIARLKAIGLSKTAVEKVLSRVKNRVRAAIAAKGRPEERSDEKREERL